MESQLFLRSVFCLFVCSYDLTRYVPYSQQKEIGFGNQLLKSYASKSSNSISNGFGSFDLHYRLASLCFILGHSYITFFISRTFKSKWKIVKQLKLGYVTLKIHHHKLNHLGKSIGLIWLKMLCYDAF